MNFFILTIILGCYVAGTLSVCPDSALLKAWQDFKVTYNKVYPNPTVEQQRFLIFTSNYYFVQNFNAEADAGKYTFHVAINQFSDMVSLVFNSLYIEVSRISKS